MELHTWEFDEEMDRMTQMVLGSLLTTVQAMHPMGGGGLIIKRCPSRSLGACTLSLAK